MSTHHIARVSNGPTEALNNLIKRIKRIGFGFRNLRSYRVRALLYAGKPNWRTPSRRPLACGAAWATGLKSW